MKTRVVPAYPAISLPRSPFRDRPHRACAPAAAAVTKYQKRISGPLLDRIDIHVEVAHWIQREPFADPPHADGKENPITCNADMRIAEVRKFCKLDETSASLMRSAMNQMNLPVCAYHRIQLARTIADLGRSENIQQAHLAEALQDRPKLPEGY